MDRSLTLTPDNDAIANAVTYISLSTPSVALAALSRSSEYSSCSAARCNNEVGSFADTGIDIVERSLPTFFRMKPIRLGGMMVGGGMLVLLRTALRGRGANDLDLGGTADAPQSTPRILRAPNQGHEALLGNAHACSLHGGGARPKIA